MEELLNISLELVSNVPPNPNSTDITKVALDAKLIEIHKVLGEYRAHEAREELIRLRSEEIKKLQAMEEEMLELIKATTTCNSNSSSFSSSSSSNDTAASYINNK